MEKIDELADKLAQMYDEMLKGTSSKDIMTKYGVSRNFALSLRYITDIDRIKEDLECIKENLNNGISLRKISNDLGYPTDILIYISKELYGEGYSRDAYNIRVDVRKEEFEIYQDMWRSYQLALQQIASEYGYSMENTEHIIEFIDKRINDRKKSCETKKTEGKFIIEKERENLERRMHLDDDIIEYIVSGKPVNYPKRKIIESKNDVGDDENEL